MIKKESEAARQLVVATLRTWVQAERKSSQIVLRSALPHNPVFESALMPLPVPGEVAFALSPSTQVIPTCD